MRPIGPSLGPLFSESAITFRGLSQEKFRVARCRDDSRPVSTIIPMSIQNLT